MGLTILGSYLALFCSIGVYLALKDRGRYSAHGRVRPYERQALYVGFALGGILLARSIMRMMSLPANPEYVIQLLTSATVSLVAFLSIRLLDRPDS